MDCPSAQRKPRRFRPSRVLFWVLGVYGALLLAVRLLGPKLVFFPEPYPNGDWTTPSGARDVFFTTSDGVKLHGWYSAVPDAGVTLIVFHGNAGNIAGRKDLFDAVSGLGMNVLMFDYRGFGRSEGAPDEEGVYRDARAAWDWLVKDERRNPRKFVFLGQSLGSAIAVELAREKTCEKLILEAPLTSAADMAGKILPFPPVGWALPCGFDSVSKVGQLDMPTLVVHGDRDSVVPFAQGKMLFERLGSKWKSFKAIASGEHNNLWGSHRDEYLEALRRFLNGS